MSKISFTNISKKVVSLNRSISTILTQAEMARLMWRAFGLQPLQNDQGEYSYGYTVYFLDGSWEVYVW